MSPVLIASRPDPGMRETLVPQTTQHWLVTPASDWTNQE